MIERQVSEGNTAQALQFQSEHRRCRPWQRAKPIRDVEPRCCHLNGPQRHRVAGLKATRRALYWLGIQHRSALNVMSTSELPLIWVGDKLHQRHGGGWRQVMGVEDAQEGIGNL